MGFDIKTELSVFAMCLLIGVLTGVLYDLFRIIRKGRKVSTVVVFMQDMTFWIAEAFLVFYGLYLTCGGTIRWYNAPLIIAGFVVYHFTVSRCFVKTGFFILQISLNVTSEILKILLFPLRFLLKLWLFSVKKLKKSKIFKKILQIRLTYRNFCFKIKKSIRKFYYVVLKR